MAINELPEEISRLQINNAKILSRISSTFSSNGEHAVLLWLWQRTEDTYAVDVIEHFELSPGRVANIIKKLEQRGYIERIQDSADLRRSRINVTERGKLCANELYSRMNGEHARIVEALGENDALEWVRLLKRMIVIAESETDFLK